MGEQSDKQTGRDKKQPSPTGEKTNRKRTDTGAAPTEGGTGRGRGGTGTEKQGQELPRLVTVNDPNGEKKEEEKPKKRGRGRPPGSKNKNRSGKPKNQKKDAAPVDTTQVKIMLATVSGIIASRPGMEVWNLTTEEIDQIADPLGRIMSRSEALANMTNENADLIALCVACFTIFVPKFLMWKSQQPKKAKEGEKIKYESARERPGNQKGTAGTDDKRNTGQPAPARKTHGENLSGQLLESIPAIGGI